MNDSEKKKSFRHFLSTEFVENDNQKKWNNIKAKWINLTIPEKIQFCIDEAKTYHIGAFDLNELNDKQAIITLAIKIYDEYEKNC